MTQGSHHGEMVQTVLHFHNIEFTKSSTLGQNWIKAFHSHITSYQKTLSSALMTMTMLCIKPLLVISIAVWWYLRKESDFINKMTDISSV
jgi:hypothetical protein